MPSPEDERSRGVRAGCTKNREVGQAPQEQRWCPKSARAKKYFYSPREKRERERERKCAIIKKRSPEVCRCDVSSGCRLHPVWRELTCSLLHCVELFGLFLFPRIYFVFLKILLFVFLLFIIYIISLQFLFICRKFCAIFPQLSAAYLRLFILISSNFRLNNF